MGTANAAFIQCVRTATPPWPVCLLAGLPSQETGAINTIALAVEIDATPTCVVRQPIDVRVDLCTKCYMPAHRYQTLTEALLERLSSDERSYAEVSRQTGLTRQSLMSFAAGNRSLRLDLADKLAKFYGLEVVRPNEGDR